jgi:hypothetical protein
MDSIPVSGGLASPKPSGYGLLTGEIRQSHSGLTSSTIIPSSYSLNDWTVPDLNPKYGPKTGKTAIAENEIEIDPFDRSKLNY